MAGPSLLSLLFAAAGVVAVASAASSASASAVSSPSSSSSGSASSFVIASSFVSAAISEASGLTAVNISGAPSLTILSDTWSATLDAVVLSSATLGAPASAQQLSPQSVSLTWVSGIYTVVALYEALEGWRFVRKTLSFSSSTPGQALAVGSVAPFDALLFDLGAPLAGSVDPSGDGTAQLGVCARFGDGSGVLLSATNPFVAASVAAQAGTATLGHVGYEPQLWWNQTTAANPTPAPYVSDGGLIAAYALSPNFVPPAPGVPFSTSWLNNAERDAFRAVAEAHFLLPPSVSPRVHIPWTLNDYQIDTSTPEGFTEYSRILTQLSRIGVERILYAGSNNAVSSYNNCTDDWCWEPALWLNMGEGIREGVWAPGVDALPPTVQALSDFGANLNVSRIPYVYPILGFRQPPGSGPLPPWLFPSGQRKGGYYADLANREFQDYFIDLTVNFSKVTHAYGAGYDYTYFDSSASQFAQWSGWRRILATVRTRLSGDGQPDYIVDNRQQSHAWSPWMWAAGSYAEPLQSDEQTTSWTAYVQDMHIDRTDGNRQRQMNYDYANNKLCQPSAMPGFFSHNTDRACGPPNPSVECNVRDFDFYGTPYTLLSAVATGAANMVVNLIPSRDLGEFESFPIEETTYSTASVAFYRTWLDFARDNRALLLKTKPFPVPPAPGVIDGTYAIADNAGYMFLFNPNSRALSTPPGLIVFDAANLDIVCAPGDVFAISEVWPVVAANFSTVSCGANFSVAVEGRNALILSVAPVAAAAPALEEDEVSVALLGRLVRSAASATLLVKRGLLRLPLGDGVLADASTPAGTRPCASPVAPLYALVPTPLLNASVTVANGGAVEVEGGGWVVTRASSSSLLSEATSGGCWPLPRSFSPAPVAPAGFTLLALTRTAAPPTSSFAHSAPIDGMGFDPSFAGGVLNGTVNVPAAVIAQLAARAAAYPVQWNASDLEIAWLAPGRLLAYIDSAGLLPSGVSIPATLNGAPVPVQEVFSCRTSHTESCFQGYWIDLSAAGVRADTDYSLSMTLPAFAPGGGYGPRDNWDMPNGDLPNMPVTLNASDANLCWALCNQTSACVAWAYGEPGAGCEPAPHCWLKATVEPFVQRTCRISGLQPGHQGDTALFQGVYYDNIDSIYEAL